MSFLLKTKGPSKMIPVVPNTAPKPLLDIEAYGYETPVEVEATIPRAEVQQTWLPIDPTGPQEYIMLKKDLQRPPRKPIVPGQRRNTGYFPRDILWWFGVKSRSKSTIKRVFEEGATS